MHFIQFQINSKVIVFHFGGGGGGSEYSEMAEKLFINMLLSQFGKKLLFAFELKIAVSFIVLCFISFILAAFEKFKLNIFCKILWSASKILFCWWKFKS